MTNADIAFLHTGEAHVHAFTELLARLSPTTTAAHFVDESLLADAQLNGLTPELSRRIQQAMANAADASATLTICTCSSIGAEAEKSGPLLGFQSRRIDRPMADLAVKKNTSLRVLAALESTLKPTTDLLQDSAARIDKTITLVCDVVPNAWPLFTAGDLPAYYDAISDFISRQVSKDQTVVLAQASMAGAVSRCPEGLDILSSPELGLRAFLKEI